MNLNHPHSNRDPISETRRKITAAFAQLRREGFLCRRNHLCCMWCMGAALAYEVDERTADGIKTVGVVGYHQQDEEGLSAGRNFCIAFGASNTDDSLTELEVGARLKSALDSAGLNTEWDGTAAHRVEVLQYKSKLQTA